MIELAELAARLGDPELTILDVRSRPEFAHRASATSRNRSCGTPHTRSTSSGV